VFYADEWDCLDTLVAKQFSAFSGRKIQYPSVFSDPAAKPEADPSSDEFPGATAQDEFGLDDSYLVPEQVWLRCLGANHFGKEVISSGYFWQPMRLTPDIATLV
jgi:hypothetical protein